MKKFYVAAVLLMTGTVVGATTLNRRRELVIACTSAGALLLVTGEIVAETIAATISGDTAVGVVLAFNSIGYEAQNILFNGVDALIGSVLVGQSPMRAEAPVTSANVTGRSVGVLVAGGESVLTSRCSRVGAHGSERSVRTVRVICSSTSGRGSTPSPGPSGTIMVPPRDSNGSVRSVSK